MMNSSKAFDWIPIEYLVAKLRNYGFSEETVVFYLLCQKTSRKVQINRT